jgi:LytS/YehU family sensor histidine kinase
VFQYGTVAAVLYAMRASRAADRMRVRAAELEASRAHLNAQLDRARSEVLRARLQPHFLFNTLNSISVLTSSDPAGAQLMVRRLSDLLRAVVDDDGNTTIPLRRELELVDAYLAIQRVRFDARLRASIDADSSVLDQPVPTFILQPLVENAIQHAVATRETGGSVSVLARSGAGRLTLSVIDDGHGCDEAGDAGRGIGLRGTRDRLALHFGSNATLTLRRSAGEGCTVVLELPMQTTG